MKLVIDRSKWLRAEGADESRLLRPNDGKMCCLGFFGLACGLEEDDLADMSVPGDVSSLAKSRWPDWLTACSIVSGRAPQDDLMEENDTDANERTIAEIFAEHGVEVEFVDGTEGG
jgi:hypothetical protein